MSDAYTPPPAPPVDAKGNYLPYGPRGTMRSPAAAYARAAETAPELPAAVYSGDGVNTSVVSNSAQPGAIPANYLTNMASVGSAEAPNYLANSQVGVDRPPTMYWTHPPTNNTWQFPSFRPSSGPNSGTSGLRAFGGYRTR